MDLRVLRYFVVIAEEENITKAASLLNITQPTLSRQIMALEEEVGATLFARKNHSIALTESGQLFRRRAEEILALAEKSKNEISQRPNLSGTLSIGAGEYGSSELLAKLLTKFQSQNPEVKFEIFSGNADSIKERVEQGLLDVAHLLEPVDISKYDFVRFPFIEEFGVFVKKDCDLAQKSFISPKDCVTQPLVLSARSSIKKELSAWLSDYSDKITISASVNLPFHVAQLVRQGSGIGFTLKKDGIFEDVKFLPLQPKLELKTLLAWKKNQILSPITSNFISFVKEEFAK